MPVVTFAASTPPTPALESKSRRGESVARPAVALRQPRLYPSPWLSLLQQSFHDTGGLVTGDALVGLLRAHCEQPISVLARWIVDRRLISFELNGERWLPLFQFDPDTLLPRRWVEQAIVELRDVFDDDELVEWFAAPNAWLGDASPAALISTDPMAVVEAAHADRFVAVG